MLRLSLGRVPSQPDGEVEQRTLEAPRRVAQALLSKADMRVLEAGHCAACALEGLFRHGLKARG